jgi:hypothetical protein
MRREKCRLRLCDVAGHQGGICGGCSTLIVLVPVIPWKIFFTEDMPQRLAAIFM